MLASLDKKGEDARMIPSGCVRGADVREVVTVEK